MFNKSHWLAIGVGVVVAFLLGVCVGQRGIMSQDSLLRENNNQITEGIKEEEMTTPFVVRDTVEGWKTCANPEGRYKVKYPEDWDMFTVLARGASRTEVDCTKGSAKFSFMSHDNFPEVLFEISYTDTYKGTGFVYEGAKSLDEYFEKRPGYLEAHPILKETEIAGERTVYIAPTRVLIYHTDRVYDISGTNLSEESFDKILNTMTFTNSK